MIIDITGVVLTPGNYGHDCLGNGEHPGIECCCDECDYMLCCLGEQPQDACLACDDPDCPRHFLRIRDFCEKDLTKEIGSVIMTQRLDD